MSTPKTKIALVITLSVSFVLLVNSGFLWPNSHIHYNPYNIHRAIQGYGFVAILFLGLVSSESRHKVANALTKFFAADGIQKTFICLLAVFLVSTSYTTFGFAELTLLASMVLSAGILSCIPPRIIALCVVVPVSLYSVLALLQLSAFSIAGIPPHINDIAFGFANPRFLGHIHTAAVPLTIGSALLFRRKSVIRFCILICAAAILCHLILAGNRGSAISISVATAFVLLIFRKETWLFAFSLAGTAFIAILLATILSSGWSGEGSINIVRSGASGRLDIWFEAVHSILEQPLLGYGAGSFSYSSDLNTSVASPHNSILLLAYEHGIPAAALGVIVVTQFVINAIKSTIRTTNAATQIFTTVALLATIIHSFVSGINITPSGQLAIVAVLAMAMHNPSMANPNQSSSDLKSKLFLSGLSITLLSLSILLMIATFDMVAPTCTELSYPAPRVWLYLNTPCG